MSSWTRRQGVQTGLLCTTSTVDPAASRSRSTAAATFASARWQALLLTSVEDVRGTTLQGRLPQERPKCRCNDDKKHSILLKVYILASFVKEPCPPQQMPKSVKLHPSSHQFRRDCPCSRRVYAPGRGCRWPWATVGVRPSHAFRADSCKLIRVTRNKSHFWEPSSRISLLEYGRGADLPPVVTCRYSLNSSAGHRWLNQSLARPSCIGTCPYSHCS